MGIGCEFVLKNCFLSCNFFNGSLFVSIFDYSFVYQIYFDLKDFKTI